MTRAEIAQLKEELAADYKHMLEALELVEQALSTRQKSQSPTASRNKVPAAKVTPSAKGSGTTIAARIEQAFQKQPKWTTSALLRAVGVKHRATLWNPLNRLVKEGKVRKQGYPGEYTRATK
jgi:hypothetical protein